MSSDARFKRLAIVFVENAVEAAIAEVGQLDVVV